MKNFIKTIAALFLIASLSACEDAINSDDNHYQYPDGDGWVEITDIDTVEDNILRVKCIDRNSVEGGILIRSKEELADIYDSELFKEIDSTLNCTDSLENINLDFENRDHILTLISSTPAEYKRNIMINDNKREIRYIFEIIRESGMQLLRQDYWSEWISIPTIKKGYKFEIDTIHTYIDTTR